MGRGHQGCAISNVVPGRLELPTSTLSVWRSNQLSYRTVTACRKGRLGMDRYTAQKTGSREKQSRTETAQTALHSIAPQSPTWKTEKQHSGSRKEVFQPHLPVRLPCYDLAPITRITLGRPSRERTSGAPGFHGLTGGVYKARERIHRAMADARLLANPASRGRVADPGPNWDAF